MKLLNLEQKEQTETFHWVMKVSSWILLSLTVFCDHQHSIKLLKKCLFVDILLIDRVQTL